MFNIALPYIRRIGKGAYGHASISPTQALIKRLGGGGNSETHSVSGATPVTVAGAIAAKFKSIVQHGKLTQSGTPTTANPVDIVCNNGALKWDSENQRIYADGTPEVLTVSADDVEDQTATAENILAVGPVADEQDIITGKVIRRTEAFVYDGTQTVKPTFMSTTGAATEGAIIVQPRGAEYAGDVVSFDAQEGENIDSLKVTLQPTQDLHGYESPWPAGGGVNKIGIPDGVDFTLRGVRYYTDAGSLYMDGTSTGETSSASAVFKTNFSFTLQPGNYYFSRMSYTRPVYLFSDSGTLATNSGTFTIAEPTVVWVGFYIYNAVFDNEQCPIIITLSSAPSEYSPFSNICPITGWTGATVTRTGKNLIKALYGGRTNAGVTYTVDGDGVISMTGTATGSSYAAPNLASNLSKMQFFRAGTYTLSGGLSSSVRLYFGGKYVDGQNFDGIGYDKGNGLTYTFLKDFYAYPQVVVASGTDTSGMVIKPQLVLGSTASTYEPYQGETYTIDWTDEAGTVYGGTLDVTTGKLTVNRAVTTWDGTAYPFTLQNGIFVNNKSGIAYADVSSSSRIIITSDRFKSNGTQYKGDCGDGNIIKVRGTNTQFGCYSSAFADVAAFNASLALNPMTTVYELATPITISLDPQTLTALQKNTVWADAGSVDVLLGDELVEMVAKQPLRTAEGDNTVSVVSEVGEVDLDIVYRRPKE